MYQVIGVTYMMITYQKTNTLKDLNQLIYRVNINIYIYTRNAI
jgi:hypothetical protein